MLTDPGRDSRSLDRTGRALVLAGGLIAGPPLVLPVLDFAACYAGGSTTCTDRGPIVLLLALGFAVVVPVVVVLVARGSVPWLAIGSLAMLAVGINSAVDLLAEPPGGASLTILGEILIVAGTVVLEGGAALRLAARYRRRAPA